MLLARPQCGRERGRGQGAVKTAEINPNTPRSRRPSTDTSSIGVKEESGQSQ
jgi:hypothetical protein